MKLCYNTARRKRVFKDHKYKENGGIYPLSVFDQKFGRGKVENDEESATK